MKYQTHQLLVRIFKLKTFKKRSYKDYYFDCVKYNDAFNEKTIDTPFVIYYITNKWCASPMVL